MTDFRRQWHRLLGIGLVDLFTGTAWDVDLEKELALQSQILDVVLIRRATAGTGEVPQDLPDGLEGLRDHNLLTFKSLHEPMDAWALDELTGHYVTYRKITRPAAALLPEDAFGLYALATRFPRDLARTVVFRETAWAGVFDIPWGARHIRLVVLADVEDHPRNAPWMMFSARKDRIRKGAGAYAFRREQGWRLIQALYQIYMLEDPNMAYTMEDFLRETEENFWRSLGPEKRQKYLDRMPPEERLRGLDPEERLRGLPPEERLRGLDPEERLRGLDPEERLRGLSPEDRLRGLSPEDLARLKSTLNTIQ